jgi:hypothetical protein
MNSIHHITFASITNYLGNCLQIDTCLRNNVDVRIIDISSIFNFPKPDHFEKYSSLVVVIRSFDELESYVEKNLPGQAIFNLQVHYEWRFRKLFRLVSKFDNYAFSIFLVGQLPFYSKKSLLTKIFSTSLYRIPYQVTTTILSRILFKAKYLSLPQNAFYAGELLKQTSKYKNLYPINYSDYDAYLSNTKILNEEYIVFLDNFFFHHPDYLAEGNDTNAALVQSYQKSINHIFDLIESTTGLKIIIACHPKINHEEHFFKHRTIVKNKTQELVQKSTFVICHFSTSVSFAVSYDKPIVFITCDAIINFSKKQENINGYISNLANSLGGTLVNADSDFVALTKNDLQIDTTKYNNFKLNYLTTTETQQNKTEFYFLGYVEKILRFHNSIKVSPN